MPIADIFDKFLRGGTLLEEEIQQVTRIVKSMDEQAGALQSLFTPSTTQLNIPYPIEVIYSKTLVEDTDVIELEIPSVYNNIIIFGSGNLAVASGGVIWADFNRDEGAANYEWQYIQGDGATVAAAEDTSFHGVVLGAFGATGAGADVSGSFRAEILHIQGPYRKNVLSSAYTSEFNDLYLSGSTWLSTAPIKHIEIFGTDVTLVKGTIDIAAGSLFTVLGVR